MGAPGPRGSARPGYRARWSGSTQRERRTTTRTADTYAMSFSFLSGRTFRELLAGLAFTSIVSPGRKRIRHVSSAPVAGGLLHDLDLHQAGYRASADGPFLDMALYDRFQPPRRHPRPVASSTPCSSAISENTCVFVMATVSFLTLANIPLLGDE